MFLNKMIVTKCNCWKYLPTRKFVYYECVFIVITSTFVTKYC